MRVCVCVCVPGAHIYVMYMYIPPGGGEQLTSRPVRLFLFVFFGPPVAPQKPGASKTQQPARRPAAIYHLFCRNQCWR